MRRMVFPYLLPLTSHSLLLTLFMLQTVIQNIIRFVVLVLVQVLVLNHVQFLGFVNPYVYVLFILSLPVRTPRWLTLVLSFGLGMAVDAFADTLGLHAFACVLAGFLRDPLVKLLGAGDDNNDFTPSMATLGMGNYVKYASVLVVVHHLAIYFLEAFNLAHFFDTLWHACLASAVTLVIVLGLQLIKRR